MTIKGNYWIAVEMTRLNGCINYVDGKNLRKINSVLFPRELKPKRSIIPNTFCFNALTVRLLDYD